MPKPAVGGAPAPDVRASTLTALVEQIYPVTGWGPGATDLGIAGTVRSFADSPVGRGEDSYRGSPFMEDHRPEHGWQSAFTPLEALDHGLDVVERWARDTHCSSFAELPAAVQEQAIEALDRGIMSGFTKTTCTAFFELLLGYVFDALFVAPTLGSYSLDVVWARLGIGIGTPEPGADHVAAEASR